MKKGWVNRVLLIVGTTSVLLAARPALSQESEGVKGSPDQNTFVRMLRRGDEAYERGRYQEAKHYYRLAILADPSSDQAWAGYERAFLRDLVDQIEKKGGFWHIIPRAPEETPVSGGPAVSRPSHPGREKKAPSAMPPMPPPTGEKWEEAPSGVRGSFIREGC